MAQIEPVPAAARQRNSRFGLIAIALGAAATIAYPHFAPGLASELMTVAASALAACTVLLTQRRAGGPVSRAWLAVGASITLLALGNAMVLGARRAGLTDLGQLANVMFLAAYVPLFAAAYRFGRPAHRSDGTVFLDTAIVGLSVVPLVWKLLIEPNADRAMGPLPAFLVVIPVMDIMLVSLALPVLLVRASRSWSAALFVAGLVSMTTADTMYAVGSLGQSWPAPVWMNVLWLTSYLLLATSSVVPSARDLGTARDPRPDLGDSVRVLVVGIGLFVVPLVMLRGIVVDRTDPALTGLATMTLVTAALVLLRLQGTIGQAGASDRRFRRFMDHDTILAVIKDRAGRYVYMNATASNLEQNDGRAWYGHTDDELYAPEVATYRKKADAVVRATHETVSEMREIEGRIWHTARFGLPGGHGEVAVLGVDITQRRRAEQEVRFQAHLLESVRDAVIVLGTDGIVTYWNRGAEEIFGLASAEVVGLDLDSMPLEAAVMTCAMPAAVRAGRWEITDWPLIDRDGRERWLHARLSPILGPDGVADGVLVVIRDITDGKVRDLELRRLSAAVAQTTDAIVVTDDQDRVVYVNAAYERMTGVTPDEVRSPAAETTQPAFARALAQARRDNGWRGDLVDRRRDGSDLITATTISAMAPDGSREGGFVTIQRDVTAERAAERASDRRARERALIAETLGSLHAGDAPEETSAAVCAQILKLAGLNLATITTFGDDGLATVIGQHLETGPGRAGVELTMQRSTYLRERAWAGPWVERWVHDPTNPYAAVLRERGIAALAYAPLLVDGQPIGVLIAGSSAADAMERLTERLPALVEFAAITTALLADEVSARNEDATSRKALRDLIDRHRFRILFQPIVGLASGEIRGYEALTRFDDGVSPEVRFQRAHDLGFALHLEAACLAAAFEASATLPDGAWLNVNVSPEIVLSGLVPPILAAKAGDRDIVLEITEHGAITDYESFRAAVLPMRDQVRIAVDDAGAGFASLRHIVELAPAMVKLDRSLVARIADDPARRAVVDGMVKFAQTSDLILIAEGIENAAELATLRELGVPLGQGFLLGRPVAPPVAPLTATEPRATARSDQAAARRAARSRAKTATKAR